MQHYSCDLCGNIMKNCEKRYLILQQEIVVRDITPESAQEAYIQSQRDQSYVKAKEICHRCKDIYDHFFSMRKEEIEQITKELEDSFYGITGRKLEESPNLIYCKCDKFYDEGLAFGGEETGSCVICKKLKKPLSTKELENLIENEEEENR